MSQFTPDELTQSSAIHGDFDHASLNYSGHQNMILRAEEDTILAQLYEIEDMENPSEEDLRNYRNLEIRYGELTESFGADNWNCNGCDYKWDAWEEGTEDGSCPKCGGFSGTPLNAETFEEDVDDGCCFCGVDYGRYGNNAQPLFDGRCCNTCNTELVIPARISMMFGSEEEERVVCFICNLTPEETDGENGPMMSTLGGDACKTCAEEHGYSHPRDMIYMDAEEIEMQSLFDMMKKQATKFTGMTILFTGIAAVGGYLIGKNRG